MIDLRWQQINFYQPINLEDSDKYNLYWMGRIWGWLALGVVGLTVLLSLWGYYQTFSITHAEQEKKTLRATLIEKSKALNVVSDENILNDEIRYLTGVLQERNKQIQVLNQQGLGNINGFSSYLTGLAHQHVLGTWLTHIKIYQGGDKFSLEGRTKTESLIADILKALNQEAVFENMVFSQGQVSQNANQEFVFHFNTEPLR